MIKVTGNTADNTYKLLHDDKVNFQQTMVALRKRPCLLYQTGSGAGCAAWVAGERLRSGSGLAQEESSGESRTRMARARGEDESFGSWLSWRPLIWFWLCKCQCPARCACPFLSTVRRNTERLFHQIISHNTKKVFSID